MPSFNGMRFIIPACLAAMACQRPVEQPPRSSEAQPDSVVASRPDALLLASAKVALPPDGVTPADLPEPNSVGAGLLATYCAQCHALPTPAAHSATDWPGVLRRMWLRMDQLPDSLGVKVPQAGERIILLNYLTGYALVVSGGALPRGRGREDFASVCSRCHALPDPAVHSADDWVAVYQRMLRNMGRMKVTPPTAEESQRILLYLQTVGGRQRPRAT